MGTTEENKDIHRLTYNGKEIALIGTAHVSRESVDLVKAVIDNEKPDTVCVELCDSRYQSVMQKERWQDMDITKVIKEKKSFLLLTNLLLASFQKRIAEKFDVKPGEEMITAVHSADEIGAHVHLADREINITLSRTWRKMGVWSKVKLLFQLLMSIGDTEEIEEEDIEKMKEEDMLQTVLAEVEKSHPVIREILIDERDQFLCEKIRTAPGAKIVAVVGAGHVPGIKEYLEKEIDIDALNELPPKGKAGTIIKWAIPIVIFLLIGLGFFLKGAETGTEMIWWWIGANGLLAGVGAIIALAHPLTILTAIVAAPLTSLNPMIAAGWVSGLTEAYLKKPKVKDLESLSDDILSFKGFWSNKVTKILLVVVLTNIGSSLGTFLAFPLMGFWNYIKSTGFLG